MVDLLVVPKALKNGVSNARSVLKCLRGQDRYGDLDLPEGWERWYGLPRGLQIAADTVCESK